MYNEYRILNLLSQTSFKSFKEDSKIENDGIFNNLNYDHTFYDIFLEIDLKSIIKENVDTLKKIVEERWFGSGWNHHEIEFLGTDFFGSLPDDTAKPLFLFWVLSQRVIRLSQERNNDKDLKITDDLMNTESVSNEELSNFKNEMNPSLKRIIEFEKGILEEVTVLNDWEERNYRLGKLIKETITEKSECSKAIGNGWKVSEVERMDEEILKCLISYWLVSDEIVDNINNHWNMTCRASEKSFVRISI